MASLTDLPGAGAQILAAFKARLQAQGVALPDRQYMTPGSLVPWDGEQLTVSLMGIDAGHPGQSQAGAQVPESAVYYASFSVNLIREVPTLSSEAFASEQFPSAEDLDGSGRAFASDAAALVLAGQAIHEQRILVGPGEDLVIGPLAPLGPEGGLAGSRLLVSLSLG